MSQSFRPNNRQDLYPHQEISRVVLSPCPWLFALHREIITVIERTTHTALTQDVSQTLPVSWKQRKGQWMHRNASKCLHMSAPWKVLWIPAEKALSLGYLGILHHLRSQVYQQKAPVQHPTDSWWIWIFYRGHAYKLTLSWPIIYYNYFMTSTAWTLPVLTYSVLGRSASSSAKASGSCTSTLEQVSSSKIECFCLSFKQSRLFK